MCLDHGTFLLIHQGEELSLEHVASILPASGGIKLVDLFGKSRELTGAIVEIDLLNKRIVLG